MNKNTMIIEVLNLTWKYLWELMPIILIFGFIITYIQVTSYYIWGNNGMLVSLTVLSVFLFIGFFNLKLITKDKRKKETG